jgi:hypothetical protein
MRLSPFVRLIELLDSLQDVHTEFFENKLQSHRAELLSRGWVRVVGYSSFHMAELFGDEMEVEVEIDEAAEVYRYPNPQRRGHIVVAPLWEVTHYSVCMDKWLEDLGDFIGLEPGAMIKKRELISGHLWHLGAVRVGKTHKLVQVYVARNSQGEASAQIKALLDDKVDPGSGILFVDKASSPKLYGEHIERCFADLVEFDGSNSTFDRNALDRILMRYASIKAESEPQEYFEVNRLKLAHFTKSLVLSDEQSNIIKHMWGAPQKLPPVMSWSAVNKLAKTGYQSFDDAFVDQARREHVIEKVGYGKYCVRRGLI